MYNSTESRRIFASAIEDIKNVEKKLVSCANERVKNLVPIFSVNYMYTCQKVYLYKNILIFTCPSPFNLFTDMHNYFGKSNLAGISCLDI